MTNKSVHAADTGLSTPRRAFLRSCAAGALMASPIAAASAWTSESPLQALIAAHRAAYDAFCKAIDREQEMEAAYNAAYPEPFRVPNLLGGWHTNDDIDECKEYIADSYKNQRRNLTQLSRIAPDLAEQVRATFDLKEAENMALTDKAFEEEWTRQEAFGYAAAVCAKDEANAAETEAALALCSYPCKTLDEARIKTEYLATAPIFSDGLEPEQIGALLQSFIGTGDGRRHEQ